MSVMVILQHLRAVTAVSGHSALKSKQPRKPAYGVISNTEPLPLPTVVP